VGVIERRRKHRRLPAGLSQFHPLPYEGEGWGEGEIGLSFRRVGPSAEWGAFRPSTPTSFLARARKEAKNAPSQRRYSLGGGKRGVFHEAGKPRGVKPFAPSDGALRGERRRALTSARDVSFSPPRGGAVRGGRSKDGLALRRINTMAEGSKVVISRTRLIQEKIMTNRFLSVAFALVSLVFLLPFTTRGYEKLVFNESEFFLLRYSAFIVCGNGFLFCVAFSIAIFFGWIQPSFQEGFGRERYRAETTIIFSLGMSPSWVAITLVCFEGGAFRAKALWSAISVIVLVHVILAIMKLRKMGKISGPGLHF
jgi:hypothetical protein